MAERRNATTNRQGQNQANGSVRVKSTSVPATKKESHSSHHTTDPTRSAGIDVHITLTTFVIVEFLGNLFGLIIETCLFERSCNGTI